jgi:predicted lipoprotein with Yx(FWY)xxD motif
MIQRLRKFAVPIVALGMVAAACGGHSGSSGSGSSGSGSTASSGTDIVKTASVNGVGTVLVNSSGRTLYMLSADKGDRVTCGSSPCTTIWPPLLVPSTPSAGPGITTSMLGTARTPAGTMQATYGGWPLYTYSGDSASGQANGQGIQDFGGIWHPLATSGSPVTDGSTASSGGGGW